MKRRPTAIRLVLMGGGLLMLASCDDDRAARVAACETARASNAPDAEAICRQAASSSGSGSTRPVYASGRPRSSGGGSVAAPSVTRGGFGSAGGSAGS